MRLQLLIFTLLSLGFSTAVSAESLAIVGSDNAVFPAPNALHSYLRLTNTNLNGGRGAQVQFGDIATDPYGIFGTVLTDGSNLGAGDFVWGLRASSAGAMTERMRLTRQGHLKAGGKLGFTGGGFFGAASTLGPTWLDDYHSPGIEGVSSLLSISPIGQSAGYFAARSSDNPNAVASVIPFTIFVANDKTSGNSATWGAYIEAYLTNDGFGSQHFNTESVIVNQWTPSLPANPYNRNPSRSTFNTRLGCGIGSAVSRRCTAALDIINETADYSSGIIIGSDALDTSEGRIAPALSMGVSHSLEWFRPAGFSAWRQFSSAESGENTIELAADVMKISAPIVVKPRTVAEAALICSASTEGAFFPVTDALTWPAQNSQVISGGNVHAPAYCNGTILVGL